MENPSSNRGRHIALRPIQRVWDSAHRKHYSRRAEGRPRKRAPASAPRARGDGVCWPLVMRRYSAKGSPPGGGFPGDRFLYGSSRASRTFLRSTKPAEGRWKSSRAVNSPGVSGRISMPATKSCGCLPVGRGFDCQRAVAKSPKAKRLSCRPAWSIGSSRWMTRAGPLRPSSYCGRPTRRRLVLPARLPRMGSPGRP